MHGTDHEVTGSILGYTILEGKQYDHSYGTAFLSGNDTIPIGRIYLRSIWYSLLNTTTLHRTTKRYDTDRTTDECSHRLHSSVVLLCVYEGTPIWGTLNSWDPGPCRYGRCYKSTVYHGKPCNEDLRYRLIWGTPDTLVWAPPGGPYFMKMLQINSIPWETLS